MFWSAIRTLVDEAAQIHYICLEVIADTRLVYIIYIYQESLSGDIRFALTKGEPLQVVFFILSDTLP